MRSASLPSVRLLALGFLGALAACTTPLSRSLSYAEVQTLHPGVSSDWILAEYPFAEVERGPGGGVRALRYTVTDPRGSSETLRLLFDEEGNLLEKRYSGPVRRPREPLTPDERPLPPPPPGAAGQSGR